MFEGDRPPCPRCGGYVHLHGCYSRYKNPKGQETFDVQRYLCPLCDLTISVLPADRLPYRCVQAARVEAFFNEQAEAGTGPDPPPDLLEAGCLRRAWDRFRARVETLKNAFGQLVPSVISSAAALWKQMRLAKGTTGNILRFLTQTHKKSLLGDYRCLCLPS